MKKTLYWCIKQMIKVALFCYYKKVSMYGLSELPKHKASMLLANHQNALMDALLIAAYSKKAPYFLTRSDVFNNSFLKALFKLLRMLPIYRMRDGRNSLGKNQEVFDNCGRLLNSRATILIFPEANHNIKRMVRPLSKGFTRILFNTIERFPELEIVLVPVGVNYVQAAGFPDSTAFYFGPPLQLNKLYKSRDLRIASMEVREEVSSAIKLLTTHIGEEYAYDEVIRTLDRLKVDYLDPKNCNAIIEELPIEPLKKQAAESENWTYLIWDVAFKLLNLPLLLIWRLLVKKRIPEVEFISTHRFLFSFVFYPVYYVLLLFAVAVKYSTAVAVFLVAGIFAFNLLYVKLR